MEVLGLGLFFVHHSKFVIQQNGAEVLGIHGSGFSKHENSQHMLISTLFTYVKGRNIPSNWDRADRSPPPLL
jgi:hypothetical protein